MLVQRGDGTMTGRAAFSVSIATAADDEPAGVVNAIPVALAPRQARWMNAGRSVMVGSPSHAQSTPVVRRITNSAPPEASTLVKI